MMAVMHAQNWKLCFGAKIRNRLIGQRPDGEIESGPSIWSLISVFAVFGKKWGTMAGFKLNVSNILGDDWGDGEVMGFGLCIGFFVSIRGRLHLRRFYNLLFWRFGRLRSWNSLLCSPHVLYFISFWSYEVSAVMCHIACVVSLLFLFFIIDEDNRLHL